MTVNTNVTVKRKSNIEIIRIIAMVMILMDHYVQHGLTQMVHTTSALYSVVSHFFGCFGHFGVTLFFLITGYFMINSQLRLKSLVKIVLNTLFYSYIIAILFIIFFQEQVTFLKVYESVLPISTAQYWFVTTYIVIYMLSPIFNFVINNIQKEKLDFYLLLFFILWFVIRPFTYQITFAGETTLLCIYVYFVGAYIKKYGISFFEGKKNRIGVYIISFLFIVGWLIICQMLHLDSRLLWFRLSRLGSIFVLFPAISVFYCFKNLNLEYNKWINILAASAFSVYLITENIWVRKIIWTKLFHCCEFSSTTYLVCNILFAVTVSYITCVIIDNLKDRLILNKIQNVIINSKLFYYIDNKIFAMLNK